MVFVAMIALNLTPIIWGILTSFKPSKEIFAFPPKLFDFSPTLEHYRTILSGEFSKALGISVFYSVACVLFGILLAIPAAYGFDRGRFRCRKPLFFLVVMGIPLSIGSSALLLPDYIYMAKLGLTDRWYTLILLYATYNLPMAIWIIKGAVEAIPVELDEAAAIDGCTTLGIIVRIILPLTRPALASAGIFLFMGAWNEFIAASVMVNSVGLRPIQVAIYNYLGFFGREWGPLTAAATVAVVPIIIAFTLLSRMLVDGLTSGAVKG